VGIGERGSAAIDGGTLERSTPTRNEKKQACENVSNVHGGLLLGQFDAKREKRFNFVIAVLLMPRDHAAGEK
jgi:hypothetical protein